MSAAAWPVQIDIAKTLPSELSPIVGLQNELFGNTSRQATSPWFPNEVGPRLKKTAPSIDE